MVLLRAQFQTEIPARREDTLQHLEEIDRVSGVSNNVVKPCQHTMVEHWLEHFLNHVLAVRYQSVRHHQLYRNFHTSDRVCVDTSLPQHSNHGSVSSPSFAKSPVRDRNFPAIGPVLHFVCRKVHGGAMLLHEGDTQQELICYTFDNACLHRGVLPINTP